MKTTLTIILSILAGAALAQTSGMTDKEVNVRWEKFLIVTSGANPTRQSEHLRSYGMTEDGVQALISFRNNADIEMRKVFAEFPQEICAKQDELREPDGAELLAQIVERSWVRSASTRRRLLAEADAVLSPADKNQLEHLYTSDHGPSVHIDEYNTATLIREGKIPVERSIENYCKTVSNQE